MKTLSPARGPAIVRISDPAMQWHEVDLNQLLACCRRELAFRERCYPRWIDKGTIKPDKAARELELMRSVCEFLVHCIFKAVTRPPSTPLINTKQATDGLQGAKSSDQNIVTKP